MNRLTPAIPHNIGAFLRCVSAVWVPLRSAIDATAIGGYVILFVSYVKIAVRTRSLHRRFSAKVDTTTRDPEVR